MFCLTNAGYRLPSFCEFFNITLLQTPLKTFGVFEMGGVYLCLFQSCDKL